MAKQGYSSKYVSTGVWGEMDSMTPAARSWSLILRELDASISNVIAVSWLQRFCAMITPTATSMAVRFLIAASKLFLASWSRARRSSKRRALADCFPNSSARAISSPGGGTRRIEMEPGYAVLLNRMIYM